jgi:hypothetical protein
MAGLLNRGGGRLGCGGNVNAGDLGGDYLQLPDERIIGALG